MGRARAAGAAMAMVVLGVAVALMAAALSPSSGAAAGGEGPITVAVGNEAPVEFDFDISPRRLPAGDPGATELRLGLDEAEYSGAGITPGITTARFGLDRSIELEPGDLPVCRVSGVNASQDAGDLAACRPAVVGHAKAEVEVDFPESMATKVPVVGNVYNGGVARGAHELLVELPIAAPVGGIVWIVARTRPIARGRLGTELTLTTPMLVGGSGVFLDLELDLRRGFTHDGERVGFVGAECRDRRLLATYAATFGDGTRFEGDSTRVCSRRPAQH